MATYNTPGIYVEEISNLAPSVAQVATAVPAFLGYTENGYNGNTVATRIDTLLDYTTKFGGPNQSSFSVDMGLNVSRTDKINFLMYYAVQMYFLNGGGSCYIISVGDYTTTVMSKTDFENGLALLEKQDEPTIIVMVDAVNLAKTDYYPVCQEALAQCDTLRDRFLIVDVIKDGSISVSSPSTADVATTQLSPSSQVAAPTVNPPQDVLDFRSNIGMEYLCYGAAYYPYLQTNISYQYLDENVTIVNFVLLGSETGNGITVYYADMNPVNKSANVSISTGTTASCSFDTTTVSGTLKITLPSTTTTAAQLVTAWQSWGGARSKFNITQNGDGSATITPTTGSTPLATAAQTLDTFKTTNTLLYNQVKTKLSSQYITLPPSSAMAGIYVSVDRDRGVWKAPANVSVASVIGPAIQINNDAQSVLNVDTVGGKSINAIRAFTGKGTLVWGARTMAGNSNDWRYISVRRLLLTIEESCQRASSFAVFESNDAVTWLKVRSMIESYLYRLWEQGALVGATQPSAYFVNVGLGKTMVPQDVLEGRMIVEVGVAPARPAEFIILRFTQMIQQS